MNLIKNRCKEIIPVFMVLAHCAVGFAAQVDSVFKSFNILTTIAGKGGAGDGVVNGWDTSFEGKAAVNAVLSGPHFAMADSIGNVFIADKDAHAIRKIDRNGKITTVAGINREGDGKDGRATAQALSSPNGLWVNKRGEFYILDLGNNKIRKVDTSGTMKTLFKDNAGITQGRGLWVSRTEDTIWYASGTQVKMWVASEGIVTYADGFLDLGNIVQDRDGYVIATDRSANLVYRIIKKGQKTVIAGNGGTKGSGDGLPALEIAFYGVRGVWFLEDNSYFLATHEGSQVWYVDTQNIAHLFLNGKEGDQYHTGDGENFQTTGYKVSEVRAVSVDYQGNALITENDRGYIRKVSQANVAAVKRKSQSNPPSFKVKIDHPTGYYRLQINYPGLLRPDVKIVKLSGEHVAIPLIRELKRGKFEMLWEDRILPQGMYTIICRDNAGVATKKIVHIR